MSAAERMTAAGGSNRQPRGPWAGLLPVLLCVCLAGGCSRQPPAGAAAPASAATTTADFHPTLTYFEPDQLTELLAAGLQPAVAGAIPAGLVPYAGTVSHHLLVARHIHHWFKQLQAVREITTFIILSPRHWVQGYRYISLSSLPWQTGLGTLAADQTGVEFFKAALNLPEDPAAFYMEHGIGTLLPFIQTYFPGSRIIPLLQKEKPLDWNRLRELADVVNLYLATHPQAFLLISTDFSHQADWEVTLSRDERSRQVLGSLTPLNARRVFCDNTGGIYLLALVKESLAWDRTAIIHHTDSFRESGSLAEGITSYFFTFYGKKAADN